MNITRYGLKLKNTQKLLGYEFNQDENKMYLSVNYSKKFLADTLEEAGRIMCLTLVPADTPAEHKFNPSDLEIVEITLSY